MEPIQVKLSFWDFISPDEVDVTDSEESIKQPHVYIFLAKKYDTNSNWGHLYKYIPVRKLPGDDTNTESTETETEDHVEEYEDADDDSFVKKMILKMRFLNPLFCHRCHSSFNTYGN